MHTCDDACFTDRHRERVKGDARVALAYPGITIDGAGVHHHHAHICDECDQPEYHVYDCSHARDHWTVCSRYTCRIVHPGASHADYIREHG
jgi:hypothetical protein